MSGTHTLLGAMQDGRFGSAGVSTVHLNAELMRRSGAAAGDNEKFREFLSTSGIEAVMRATPSTCGRTACSDLSKSVETAGEFASAPADGQPSDPMPADSLALVALSPV